nr:Holliday junction branch migration protein RuvA [Corynebacterium sputi]
MIASVRGVVVDKTLDSVVIETHGIGRLVHVTGRTSATLPRGEEVYVPTHLIVREDALTLYGFQNSEERAMFTELQKVSKLGPRIALAVLEVMDPPRIAAAVATNDVAALSKANGVGKRLAERMVLELKGKLGGFDDAPIEQGELVADTPTAGQIDTAQVIGALVGLGFKEPEAESAVASVVATDPSVDTSHALRAALKLLGR